MNKVPFLNSFQLCLEGRAGCDDQLRLEEEERSREKLHKSVRIPGVGTSSGEVSLLGKSTKDYVPIK